MTADAHASRRSVGESGSALEAVIGGFTFALIVVILAVGYATRAASNQVEDAAREAARSAATRPDPATAADIANDTVHANLDQLCATVDVASDLTDFHPGGSVTVTVTCLAPLARLGPIAGPDRTVVSSATEVVDRYRGGT